MSEITVAGTQLQNIVDKKVDGIRQALLSRGTRAANELRNAELEVLSGTRSGRVYKVPGTYGKRASKYTKTLKGEYGHELRGGQLYRASAAGEAPARRLGDLRRSWNTKVNKETGKNGIKITPGIETDVAYAQALEDGTPKMKPRPYKDRIIDLALPKIGAIYKEPYGGI